MKKQQIFSLASAACLSVVLLAGCGNAANSNNETSSNNAGNGGTALSGTVATGGSTSMQSLMSMLQEDFMDKNGNVTVTYDPTGSGAGITGVSDGSLDIGLASRALSDEEAETLEAITVCLDGIAVVVNNANPIADLSIEQLAAIFSGEITNWNEVGGSDGRIVVIGREAGSGTRDGFESIVGVEDVCVYDQELTATGAVTAAVAANENAIGYASLSAVDDSVSAITVEGVACTEEAVKDGSYKIQRPFNFIIPQNAELSDTVQAFITYVTNGSADEWISEAGCVTVG